ncbi:hypothetical protein ACTXM3_09325 [Glutamicibacter arilaitensis]|uniref:hypothetical protein n=1 Tax=Glutamicibacter arilaitensis TaxID=256701 RepID=UPI003FD036FE
MAASLRYLKNVGKSVLKTVPSVFLLIVLVWSFPIFITKLTHEEQLTVVFVAVVLAILTRIALTFQRSMKQYESMSFKSIGSPIGIAKRTGSSHLATLDDLHEQRRELIHQFHDEAFVEFILATSEPDWTAKKLTEHAIEKHPMWLKSTGLPSRIDVAHHEAGHALLAHLNGSTVLKVTVAVSGSTAGRCEYANDYYQHPSEEMVWAMLKTSLAGQAVDHARGIRDTGSTSDMQSCISHAYNLISIGKKPDGYEGELTTDALIGSAREITKEVVSEHMDTISELAELLIERTTLNGREVRLFFEARIQRKAIFS